MYNKQPHVHAELIKAWADGAVIQENIRVGSSPVWVDIGQSGCHILWSTCAEYRIKPIPKPDVVVYVHVKKDGNNMPYLNNPATDTIYLERIRGKVQFVFDGETGKLKEAIVL